MAEPILEAKLTVAGELPKVHDMEDPGNRRNLNMGPDKLLFDFNLALQYGYCYAGAILLGLMTNAARNNKLTADVDDLRVQLSACSLKYLFAKYVYNTKNFNDIINRSGNISVILFDFVHDGITTSLDKYIARIKAAMEDCCIGDWFEGKNFALVYTKYFPHGTIPGSLHNRYTLMGVSTDIPTVVYLLCLLNKGKYAQYFLDKLKALPHAELIDFSQIKTLVSEMNSYPAHKDTAKKWLEGANTQTEGLEKTKSGKWTNKGKEGKHGTFKTKKAARQQQKAMFANGFHESLLTENVSGNTAIFNGKKFVCGSVNLTDGTIEEVVNFRKANLADWHHSFMFSESQVDKLNSGECAFFMVYENNDIMIDPIGRQDELSEAQKKELKAKILKQIKFINNSLTDDIALEKLIKEACNALDESVEIDEGFLDTMKRILKAGFSGALGGAASAAMAGGNPIATGLGAVTGAAGDMVKEVVAIINEYRKAKKQNNTAKMAKAESKLDKAVGEKSADKMIDETNKLCFAEDFKPAEETEDIAETIEKHDELNQKLFDGEKLKPEVVEKITDLVDMFQETLTDEGITLNINDIVITGSNASYNYTEDSDLDIHVLTDTADDKTVKLYGLACSNFNAKIKPNYYGIPVEVYIEATGIPAASNGCYSVLNNDWVNKPDKDKIPEPDNNAIDKKIKPWEERYEEVMRDIEDYLGNLGHDDETDTSEIEERPTISNAFDKLDDINEAPLTEEIHNKVADEIDSFIDDVYKLRTGSINVGGEYSDGNLLFKEIRNRGMLDNMKKLKNTVLSKELSVEDKAGYLANDMPKPVSKEETTEDLMENTGRLAEKARIEYRNKIYRLTHIQPIIKDNGIFELYQVSEQDANMIVMQLKRQDYIEYANATASGQYDFSHIGRTGKPTRKYTIRGKIKID